MGTQFVSARKKMGTAIRWQDEIAAIAGPFDGNRKGWLSRAARLANVTYRQIHGLYYDQVKDPKHSVASNILTAAEQARIAAAKLDASSLASQFESIAGGMLNADEDFYSADASALINAARILRGLDSAGNKGEVK